MQRLILAVFATALSAHAQVSSGTLFGEVTDESAAIIADVKLTARNNATGFTRTTNTGPLGTYQLIDIAPGIYTVIAERSGFRTTTMTHVAVEVNQKARLDLQLKIGAAHDDVTVRAGVSLVQSGDASEGYQVSSAVATQLPLASRNVIELMTLGPGAIPRQLSGFTHDLINDVQQARGAVALNPTVNGARSTMNTFILDGAYNTDRNVFAAAIAPPMESVQEFRIQSSLGSAEFAQSGGALVDIVTKSGSRSPHGSAFEFLRNEATDAHSYFDNPTLPHPLFRQNQYGASFGGPLPLRSTYFYATYEGVRGQSAKTSLHLVPNAVVRTGDFTGRNTIYDPLKLDPVTGARQPFPGNVIPSNRIDPIATRFLQGYEPLPNLTGSGSSNYSDSTPNQTHTDAGSMRIDRQFGTRNWLFARYTINDDRNRLAGNFPERPTSEQLRAQQAALGYTAAGPAWVNEARLSFTRLRVFDVPDSAFGVDVLKELGITSTAGNPVNFGLPYFVVTDFDTVTDNTLSPQTQRDNTWQLGDGFTWTRGRHTFKAGAQWIHFQLNYLQSQFVRGQYVFNGSFTSLPSSSAATGDAFADFLLGFAQQTRRNAGSPMAYLRQNSYGAYAQDDWRLSSRLTLTFGLRYEYASPFSEMRNRLLNLDYSNLPHAPALVATPTAGNPDRNNFAPRFGLAWRLPRAAGHETVFRAGYGIYFSPEIAIEAYDLVRNNLRIERNQTTGPTPVLTIANGFPTNSLAGFPSYYGLDPRAATPYLQQWSAGFQHEMGHGVLLEVSYIGTKGSKLGRFRTFNTPAHVETGENLAPRPGALQSLRTFPELGPITQRQHIANSSYNSLEIKSEKRMSGRVSFLASFVWSKSIDDADTIIPGFGQSIGAQDERNLRLERGLSVFNVGRRLSAGFVYSLPSARFVKPVLSNWSTTGILTFQDGSPFNPVYLGNDFANSGTPNRPNIVPGQSLGLPASQRTAQVWLNPGSIAAPAPLTFGNAGRNILPSPGNAVVNMSLHRAFRVRERASLQFRAEAFNVLNHPNWGVPSEYADFFFGRIFTTGEPRRLQFGLRLDF